MMGLCVTSEDNKVRKLREVEVHKHIQASLKTSKNFYNF